MQLAIAIVWGIFAIGLHLIGDRNDWYSKYKHFDWLTHAVSGGGLFFLLATLLDPKLYIAWITFVLLVILWEVFEYVYGDPGDLWHSPRDMVTDMIMSLLAAIVVFMLLV